MFNNTSSKTIFYKNLKNKNVKIRTNFKVSVDLLYKKNYILYNGNNQISIKYIPKTLINENINKLLITKHVKSFPFKTIKTNVELL